MNTVISINLLPFLLSASALLSIVLVCGNVSSSLSWRVVSRLCYLEADLLLQKCQWLACCRKTWSLKGLQLHVSTFLAYYTVYHCLSKIIWVRLKFEVLYRVKEVEGLIETNFTECPVNRERFELQLKNAATLAKVLSKPYPLFIVQLKRTCQKIMTNTSKDVT